MTSYVPAKRATEHIFYVSLESQSSAGTFQADPTLASGDVTVSKDGGAAANLATLPTVTPAAGKRVKVMLSSGEMDADNVAVLFSDASGAEWYDLMVNIQTAANQIDDLATAANLTTVDTVVDSIKAVTDALPDAGALTTIGGNVTSILADTGTDGVVVASGSKSGYSLAADQSSVTVGTVTTVTDLTNAPTNGDLTATMKASVNAEADTAIADASLATASALSTLSMKVLKYFQLLFRKDAAIATDNAIELTAINADGGSGAGAYDNTTDSAEAIRERGDLAWTGGSLTEDGIADAVWTRAGGRTVTGLGDVSDDEFTYTVTDGSNPIADVSVWFSSSSSFAAGSLVWYGTTDAFGIARDAQGNKPRLSAGTYYILLRKTGYTFAVDAEVVS